MDKRSNTIPLGKIKIDFLPQNSQVLLSISSFYGNTEQNLIPKKPKHTNYKYLTNFPRYFQFFWIY